MQVFKNKKPEKQSKQIYNILKKILFKKIEKMGKLQAISLENIRFILNYAIQTSLKNYKYKLESAKRTTILIVFLAKIITKNVYNTKTAI